MEFGVGRSPGGYGINGGRDVAEPVTLYLWDAVKRAGLSYRCYGEFIQTLSEADLKAINSNRSKPYPDLTPTVRAFATKRSLEDHIGPSFRAFFGSFVFGTPEFPLSDVPLQSIAEKVAAGRYQAKPSRVFRFEDIREAHRLMKANEAIGKIVIRL